MTPKFKEGDVVFIVTWMAHSTVFGEITAHLKPEDVMSEYGYIVDIGTLDKQNLIYFNETELSSANDI